GPGASPSCTRCAARTAPPRKSRARSDFPRRAGSSIPHLDYHADMKHALPILAALLLAGACALAPAGAFAKDKADKKEAETIELPEKLSPEEADALLAKLTDAQARQLLSRQLHKQAQKQVKSQDEEESFAMMLVRLRGSIESSGELSEQRGAKLVDGWRQLPAALEAAAGEFGSGPLGLLRQLAIFAVIG